MTLQDEFPDGFPPEQIPRNAIIREGTMAATAIQAVIPWLRRAGVPDAARDSRVLMAEAFGVEPGALPGRIRDPLPKPVAQRFDSFIKRRMRREPVSHIRGRRYFMTRSLLVSANVLDPRPETEVLVRLAMEEPYMRVLDLGTGSGAILCTLLADRRGIATGVGVDTGEEVCQVAYDNAQSVGVGDFADIFISDWFEHVEGTFDLIVTNPPYIAAAEMADLAPEVRVWEPHFALTDGGDGLGAYRRIAQDLPRFLRPGGRFLCEIGPTQASAVRALLEGAGLTGIEVHPDLDGRDRVLLGRMPH